MHASVFFTRAASSGRAGLWSEESARGRRRPLDVSRPTTIARLSPRFAQTHSAPERRNAIAVVPETLASGPPAPLPPLCAVSAPLVARFEGELPALAIPGVAAAAAAAAAAPHSAT
jgi:hypothetical protein